MWYGFLLGCAVSEACWFDLNACTPTLGAVLSQRQRAKAELLASAKGS